MIAIVKSDKPEKLAQNQHVWTEEYRLNPKSRRYADPAILRALEEECRGKCVYCESKIEPVAAPNVEHILPKSIYPDLVCEWTNLTIACPRCNQFKHNYDSVDRPLLNPVCRFIR